MSFSLFDLLTQCYTDFACIAYKYASELMQFLIYGLSDLFSNSAVISYETFISIFADFMLVVGIGFAVATWAIEANEGVSANIMTTFKNCILGLFVCLGFVIIPVNLLKFTAECCQLLIKNMSITNISESLNKTMTTDTTVLGKIIFPLFAISVFVCCIKVFLSNVKRGGTLLILLSVCPLHVFSIPRGYTDAFFSWCKQVIALCLTTFIQNFLVVLSFLILSSSDKLTTANILMSLGVALAAFEAPRIMDQFGMDTTFRGNITQVFSSVNTVTRMVKG